MPPRPTAITVLARLNITIGIVAILMTLLGFGVVFSPKHTGNVVLEFADHNTLYREWIRWATVLRGIACCGLLISGLGLLKLKPWSRILALVYAVYGLLAGVVATLMYALVLLPAMVEKAEDMPVAQADMTKYIAYGSILGGLISMAYPITLLHFMRQRHVIIALRQPFTPPPVPRV